MMTINNRHHQFHVRSWVPIGLLTFQDHQIERSWDVFSQGLSLVRFQIWTELVSLWAALCPWPTPAHAAAPHGCQCQIRRGRINIPTIFFLNFFKIHHSWHNVQNLDPKPHQFTVIKQQKITFSFQRADPKISASDKRSFPFRVQSWNIPPLNSIINSSFDSSLLTRAFLSPKPNYDNNSK